jgi:mono/diheme cytochrome c family protein
MRDLDQHASSVSGSPEPVRQYLISQQQVKTLAVLSAVGMAAVLIVLFLLASARPQARLQALDTTEFRNAVTAATADLDGYEQLPDGRARIDIDRAMELVAQRGVGAVGIVSAAAAAAGATVPAGSPAGDAAGGQAAGEVPAQAAADIDGATAYALCAACHQGNGMGIPGAFPPLAGHGPELYVADRTYPILVLLYGVMGQIQVSGMPYNGLMPAHGQLDDATIAAILNYVMTAFGNSDILTDFEAYEVADVAAERGRNLSFTDVYALRSELGLP